MEENVPEIRFLTVTDNLDDHDDFTVCDVLEYVLRGVFVDPKAKTRERMKLTPEEVEARVSSYDFVVVVHHGRDGQAPLTLGPKCTAAVRGCQASGTDYLVLTSFLTYDLLTEFVRAVVDVLKVSEDAREVLRQTSFPTQLDPEIRVPIERLTMSFDQICRRVTQVIGRKCQSATVTETSSSG